MQRAWSTTRASRCLGFRRRPSAFGQSSAASTRWVGSAGSGAAIAANEAEIELIHSPDHVDYVREAAVAGGGAADSETWIGEASYRAALHAAGGACAMTRALLTGEAKRGFCGVRPPGHHAERDRAQCSRRKTMSSWIITSSTRCFWSAWRSLAPGTRSDLADDRR